jgi:hypothetical protein
MVGLVLILGVSLVGSAQLQQSGGPGSTVTANIGTTNGLALDATLTSGSQKTKLVDSAGTNLATISAGGALKVDGSAVTQPVSGTFWQATQPVSGTVNTVPKTACGNTVASQALAAVPTSATVVFSATTCVIAVVMNNTTGASLTVTVTDNAGTPINDVLTFSIPANSQLIQPLYGMAFTSGVKWTASGAGVTGGAIGYQ